jgi:hypothetical protein
MPVVELQKQILERINLIHHSLPPKRPAGRRIRQKKITQRRKDAKETRRFIACRNSERSKNQQTEKSGTEK